VIERAENDRPRPGYARENAHSLCLRIAPFCLFVAALGAVAAGCGVGTSEASETKPTIEDCSNWSGDKRCPKACFAPPVTAGSIQTYTPRFDDGIVRAGATTRDQERLAATYANDLGPRKVKLGGARSKNNSNKREHISILVALQANGIKLIVDDETLPPKDGCKDADVTLCTVEPSVDISAMTRKAAEASRDGDAETASSLVDEIIDNYDWKGLYNALMEIKEQHPKTSFIRLRADARLPHALVVRTMDVARVQLEEPRYESSEAFESATARVDEDGKTPRQFALFPRPIVQLPLPLDD
jgi:hypothetical protein